MALVCPNCGQENPDVARFCLACGASLEALAGTAEERKLVSVLFCDLVGHTAASDRADPEDVRARLRPYHQLLKREIERYGGTVEKFVGDAVMAVFGAPVAHEDDAERAVRAGLRILEAVEGLELEVRAAVATGEAVVTLDARPEQGEGMVAGDVVNTASRLQQAAPRSSLVLEEVTYRTTRDAIEYEELEPVTVKGKAGPVALWRAAQARSRFGVDVGAAQTTPFVGREHDLALLRNTYERALGERAVQLVTVAGEPGVGKSRLVAELRSWVDERPERVRWRQGRCLPYGEGITYWALGEIVKAQAGIRESDGSDEAAEKLELALETAVEQESERRWLTTRLAPLVGAVTGPAAGVEREEAFAAWRRFLEALAVQRPLVLVLEDLHWADSALLEFFDYLVDWASDVAMLVVCTARPELYERHPGWGGGKRNSTTISLSPLSGEETARLIAGLLARAVLPAGTQSELLERSGGNPLYAEEFVRMLTDRGFLTPEGELVAGGQIPVPESVQALIAARLDTLAPDRKTLLYDGAVMGKVFWPGSVAAIGAVDRSAVERGLRELVRRELVRPARGSSVEGEEEFSFWHLLVRDVAYGQIPRAARAQKHRAAAEWIEEIAGERIADHAELLAEHYRQALELTRAARSDEPVESLAAKTARALTLAGDRALDLDLAKAERHYLDALELVTAGTREHAELLDGLARSSPRVDARNLELRRAVVREFQALGDERRTAGAMANLGRVLWRAGQTRESQDVLMQALVLAEDEPGSAELADVYTALAGNAMVAGRAAESIGWAEKALPIAEGLGLVAQKGRLLQFIGASRCLLSDPGGLDDLREALRLGLDSGAAPETALAYVNLAGFASDEEGPHAALPLYREGADFAERRGLRGHAEWARGEATWSLFEVGAWDEVVRRADDVRGDESQLGVLVRTQEARVLAERGATHEAGAELEVLLPRAREIEDAQILVPALVVAGSLEALSGRSDSAVELIRELDAATQDRLSYRFWYFPELARICLRVDARDVLAGSLDDFPDLGFGRFVHGRRTAAAVLAEMEGRLDDAGALYAEAAEGWREFGSVVEEANALLGRGRCLGAVADLDAAKATFERLGASPLAAEADRYLAAREVG